MQVPLAIAETCLYNGIEPLKFHQNVSPLEKLRGVSSQVESGMRLDVFKAKTAAKRNIKTLGRQEMLSVEGQRPVEKMPVNGKRAGLALPDPEREELASFSEGACAKFTVTSN